jgi:hypothetical protein
MIRRLPIALIAAASAVCDVMMLQPVAMAANPPAQGALESEKAVVLARSALARQLNTDISGIQLVSVEPQTWRNSGLGCAPPGAMTLQVITEGYAVVLEYSGAHRRVHVAGNKAIVCDAPAVRLKQRSALSARNISVMSERAREDLARRLGVPVAEIQVTRFAPRHWKNTALECPKAGETTSAERPVRGYELLLRHRDREFTYHADAEQVRPCPDITSD